MQAGRECQCLRGKSDQYHSPLCPSIQHHHATTIAVAITIITKNASHHHHPGHRQHHLLGCSGRSAWVDGALRDGGVVPPLVPAQHVSAQRGLDSQWARVMAMIVMAVDGGESEAQLWCRKRGHECRFERQIITAHRSIAFVSYGKWTNGGESVTTNGSMAVNRLRTASARLFPVHSCMSALCEATLMRPD